MNYIAIGNANGGEIAVAESQLDASGGGNGVAIDGPTGAGGEMARKLVTPDIDVTAKTNAVVTLTNEDDPFTFKGTRNATTITQSALFNASGDPNPEGETTSINGEMLAAQDLSPSVTVTDGDSLTVTWTITIGTGPS